MNKTNIEKKRTSPALFVRQVRQELQKVTWPPRKDTLISSAIVILLIILLSIPFLPKYSKALNRNDNFSETPFKFTKYDFLKKIIVFPIFFVSDLLEK